MKRKIAVIGAALLLMATSAVAQTSGAVNFGWKNNNPSMTGCVKPTDPSCLTSIVLSDITSVTPVIISGTIAYNAATFSLNTLPAAGTHTYSIVATGNDVTGKAITSVAATTTVAVPLASITSFTATYVPAVTQ